MGDQRRATSGERDPQALRSDVHRLSRLWPEGTSLFLRSAAASAASSLQNPSPNRGMTRRRLLATGGAAGAAAAVGFRPWDPTAAHAADADTPLHLRRSTYLKLSTLDFGTSRLGASAGIKLVSVGDLSDPKLVNSEDAFALTFTSNTPFESGTRSLAHPDLGVFELFIAPIEGNGNYEAIVNRSVGVPKRAPHPPSTPAGGKPPAAGSPKPPGSPKHVRPPAVRSAHLRRVGKGLAAQVALDPQADVKSLTTWVARAGMVVASADVRHLHGRHRVNVELPTARRLRGGHYELTVGTKDHHGHTEYKQVKIALQ